jgi:simple sugar transport system ATP-binding protein
MKELSLIDIYKSFDSNTVLKGINLTFNQGEVTAILGDNGAGKSTLLKSLSGLVELSSGQIIFNNLDITPLSVFERRAVGIEVVYQDYALFKNHSILANLFAEREITSSTGFLDNKKMREEASNLFTKLNLDTSLLDTYPRMLSGGQQQIVAIARAILFKPKVILLDEPTAALGAKEVKRTLDLIRELKKQDKIIILVSHRFQDVFDVADRLVILKGGVVFSDRLVAESTIEGVVQEIVS